MVSLDGVLSAWSVVVMMDEFEEIWRGDLCENFGTMLGQVWKRFKYHGTIRD